MNGTVTQSELANGMHEAWKVIEGNPKTIQSEAVVGQISTHDGRHLVVRVTLTDDEAIAKARPAVKTIKRSEKAKA